MRFDDMIDNAHDFVSSVPPAMKGTTTAARKTASSAAEAIRGRAEGAREALADKATEAKTFTLTNLFRAYDVASRLLPMVFPERAARVRNRRLAYAAAGGLLLGAGAIAVVELRRPGTLAALGRRIQRVAGRGVAAAESTLAESKEAIVAAAGEAEHVASRAKDKIASTVEEAKEEVSHGVELVKDTAGDVARDVKADLERAKEKVARAAEHEQKNGRRYTNGSRHSS